MNTKSIFSSTLFFLIFIFFVGCNNSSITAPTEKSNNNLGPGFAETKNGPINVDACNTCLTFYTWKWVPYPGDPAVPDATVEIYPRDDQDSLVMTVGITNIAGRVAISANALAANHYVAVAYTLSGGNIVLYSTNNFYHDGATAQFVSMEMANAEDKISVASMKKFLSHHVIQE